MTSLFARLLVVLLSFTVGSNALAYYVGDNYAVLISCQLDHDGYYGIYKTEKNAYFRVFFGKNYCDE